MEDFPLLQNSTSCNPVPADSRLPHNLDLINGIRVVRDTFGPSKDEDFIIYDPAWTYGEDKINDPTRLDKTEEPRFVPDYVIFAQKCLKFNAYFRQNVDTFLNQRSSIRNVIIYYFLEDDTMSVIEPFIVNAGCKQGKLVKRSKIPKNEYEFYHWKDLNVGITIKIYGINYHLLDCDGFTRNFLTSQGIDVNQKQDPPSDSNDESALLKVINKPHLKCEIHHNFRKQDDVVLTFVATWNDDKYSISYYLVDDTILVRKIPRSKDDDDPMSKVLLRRTKVIKENAKEVNRYVESLGSNQPSTDEFKLHSRNEIEYYGPKDFRIGETVTILGRQFHLIDCNYQTRRFYSEKLGINQPDAIAYRTESQSSTSVKTSSFSKRLYDTPFSRRPYGGIAKRDAVIRQLLNLSTKFRYSMKMDAVHAEDEDRQFILEYNLGDGTMAITEIPIKNGGRTGGGFLAPAVVAKPDSNEDEPVYYTEQDLYIGAKINVFNHHFIITGADLAVWNYIKKHPNDFNEHLRNSMREHFEKNVAENVTENVCDK